MLVGQRADLLARGVVPAFSPTGRARSRPVQFVALGRAVRTGGLRNPLGDEQRLGEVLFAGVIAGAGSARTPRVMAFTGMPAASW
ncbi:hypothetical protein [Saccharopolyspora pogona]|uniref:hypothetical protein n=1 Tax=Saccharopolyspora pogona TaxID=333966 RepID=UPI00168985BA|nr:hypothetical protein [Saccharopolyspora pogona]